MSRFHPLEGALGFLLIAGITLHLFAGADYGKRNYEYLPNMAETPGYEAQDPNPNFEDGMTLRMPVPGTVARNRQPLMHEGRLLDVTTPDWNKLSREQQAAWDAFAPHDQWEALDEDGRARMLDKGRARYQSVCATCHGSDGKGATPVTKRGVPPPPTLIDPKMRAQSDGRVYRTITVGQGNMAGHANQVPRGERWLLIRYLRTLQETKQ